LSEAARERWIKELIGRSPHRPELFVQALTHGSASSHHYERLEFLGDRVLGLAIGERLFTLFPGESEGVLSMRFNQLVSGEVCASVAQQIGIQPHMILGKQARDDGASKSTNVLGDMMEALIGALFLDSGLEEAQALVNRLWADQLEKSGQAVKHPKSELQEWAAAHKRKPPEYKLVDRTGPPHNPIFTVSVAVLKVGEASASGSSKQEAETEAAKQLLEQLR